MMTEDWKQQIKSRIHTWDNSSVEDVYPFVISDFFLNHIKSLNYPNSLTRQFMPSQDELADFQNAGHLDPIGDKLNHKADKLIHRYQNRVLVTPTTVCPVNCRYCFRKNSLLTNDELFAGLWSETLLYLKNHPEVEEVIFTGGDPLMLSDEKIDLYLSQLKEIKHIKWIRFHTRTPIIIPSRMNSNLAQVFKKYSQDFKKIILVIHTNHIDEISADFKKLISEFNHIAGCELLSQSVLLKGVNDNSQVLIDLINELINLNIRPYYLHHPDKVKGGMHFYISIEDGRKIYAELRNKLSGWALPHYVIDSDLGQGKSLAFNPEKFEFSGQLINKNAQVISHQEPTLTI